MVPVQQTSLRRPELGVMGVEAGGEGGSDESVDSEPSEAGEEPPPVDPDAPLTDDTQQQLAMWQEADNHRKIKKLKRKRQKLETTLEAYRQKEKEFVRQMDSHMDDVERKERSLGIQINTLQTENQQLRTCTDRRARDNAALADKLSETTKQCSEAETRVQFLVDRIVALLSAGSGDPSQTEAVVNMRYRERELLKQLDETRAQFDEVRQQNGELTSRLTEELTLSRRLQDQLAEVEERFFQHGRTGQALGEDGVVPLPGGRLGGRPLGLRSDQTEALPGPLPERVERPLPPEVPPPISEVEVEDAGIGYEEQESGAASGVGALEASSDSSLTRVPNGTRNLPTIWPTTCSRTTSAEDVQVMEQKLREALDKASFECQVVRVENGIYEFGSNRAVVELTEEHQVVASVEGKPFEPIDDFIENISQETRQQQAALAAQESQTPGHSVELHQTRSAGSSLSAFSPELAASEVASQIGTPLQQASPILAPAAAATLIPQPATQPAMSSPQVAHVSVLGAGATGCYSAAAPVSPAPAARVEGNPRTISPRGVAVAATLPQGIATSQGLAPTALGVQSRQGRGRVYYMPSNGGTTPERAGVTGRPATPMANQLHTTGLTPRRDARAVS
mmetsp:Transcript_15905/g.29095  ORF Transcript_15905/g.29095 Transcript_15905/m.29095 type:complete len:623 (+) Transcript_15905:94-1962(+)